MSKNRTIASLISNDTSKIKTVYTDSDSIVTSASLGVTAAAGTATYSSADTLPASADNGDQALVTSTNRLYIFTNGGWYNIALINSTPYWSTEASSSYDLNTDGTSTTITLLAIDSEGIPITYTAITDSDFDGIATITKDSDNGRIFTIIPIDSDNGTAIAGTGTVTFRASDGVNLVSTLSTFSITFNIENSNYTTLLIKADTSETDDQVDASSNANTITQIGTVDSTALSPYHPGGYSTYFDGTGDYINITSAVSAIGTNDFTVEAWVYITGGTGARHVWDFRPTSTDGNYPTLRLNTSNQFEYIAASSVRITSTAVSLNTWHHVAIVRNSSTTTLYVDGTSDGTWADTTSYLTGSNRPMIGGSGYHVTTLSHYGYISDFRFVDGTAVYTSNFTSPTSRLTAIANTSLLTCHLPYIADGSSNDHTVTIVGNTTTERFGPYNYSSYSKSTDGGSVYVGGATSYLSTNLPAMTGDWTIEGWIQHTANTGTSFQNRIFGGATNDPMILNTGLNSLNVYIDNNLKITANAAANTAAGINRWYHMALVRETTGNTLKLYINGKLAGSQSSGTYDIDAKDPFGIGSDANNSAYGMTGYIADFRVVNGTAVYTAEFTPPTEPLTEIANTDLLTATNKNDIWDTGSGSRVSEGGNATASDTQRQFTSSSAIYFDGNGDYIDIYPADTRYALGSKDFTIDMWVNFTITSLDTTYRRIFMADDGGNIANNLQLLVDVGGTYGSQGAVLLWAQNGSNVNSNISSTTAINDGNWHHVAISRTSNTVRLFVDGVRQGTNLTSWTHGFTTATIPRFGADATVSEGNYAGYIQDFRLLVGKSLYTSDSNITVPTAEFDG